MSSQCFPFYSTTNTNLTQQANQPLIQSSLAFPIMTSFSSLISFKINKTQLNSTRLVAEVILRNGTPLWIKPLYKTIFTKQLQCIFNSKLTQINNTFQMAQKIPQHLTEYWKSIIQKDITFCSSTLVDDKNQIKIEFTQIKSMMEQNKPININLIHFFLFFLKEINTSLILLLQKIGTLKPSYAQKLKNLRQIELSKKTFKKIFKNKNQFQHEIITQEIFQHDAKSCFGVFQHLNVIRQQQMKPDELVFKRGGYFNIVKRKLMVSKTKNQVQEIQCKTLAEKKLSGRKRPNTAYNYEGKTFKELKLLQCLNNLSFYELQHFAKYYILELPRRPNYQSEQMIDESDCMGKDTISTMSQDSAANSMTDVIYMEFYEENLEEYINRRGKLQIFQILCLLKQIFQSVLILHKVGIVHRDIKPANFMIEQHSNGTLKTKLIDFGESSHVTSTYDSSQILGFSTQYAPIECTYPCKEGFNSKQIDLWSVGVVAYKLITNRMPVTYSKCFKSDIKYEWPTSLSFFFPQFGRGRWAIIQNMLVSLSLMFMRVKPEERFGLEQGLKTLDRIQKMANHFIEQKFILSG